jgi:hypothetical protein
MAWKTAWEKTLTGMPGIRWDECIHNILRGKGIAQNEDNIEKW